MGPDVTSRSAALSRTLRVTTNSAESPLQRSPNPGPKEFRARVGFRPTMAHMLAGPRIEPPPSLAFAAGTMPPATADEAPPDDQPEVRDRSQGFAVWPNSAVSVEVVSPNSGECVLPKITRPARL